MIPSLRDFCINSGIRILENDIFHGLDDFVLFPLESVYIN